MNNVLSMKAQAFKNLQAMVFKFIRHKYVIICSLYSVDAVDTFFKQVSSL